MPAFVATLGMLYVARGIALLMTNGLTYNNLGGQPELGNTGFDWLGFNRICSACRSASCVLAVVAIVVQRRAQPQPRSAAGSTPRAATSAPPSFRASRSSGSRSASTSLSGVCAAIAGLVLSSQLTSAGPTAGTPTS